jgi:hypothetical protein
MILSTIIMMTLLGNTTVHLQNQTNLLELLNQENLTFSDSKFDTLPTPDSSNNASSLICINTEITTEQSSFDMAALAILTFLALYLILFTFLTGFALLRPCNKPARRKSPVEIPLV